MDASPRICAVLASDARFFYQTRLAIESIRRAIRGDTLDVRLIAIGPFEHSQLEWLRQMQVTVFDNLRRIPTFHDGPLHAVALTCRPCLPEIFPDVDGFLWIDSDVRFLLPTGLVPWLAQAGDRSCPAALCGESDPAYSIQEDPTRSAGYHREKCERLSQVYGSTLAHRFDHMYLYNAGIFAIPACSPVWGLYRAHLNQALSHHYNHMREQDALNLAVAEAGVRPMPCTLNWLCSLAPPVKGPYGDWSTPDETHRPIEVAHLTNSELSGTYRGQPSNFYQMYRAMGLTG